MKSRRKPSPVLTKIMSRITDEDREKTRKKMMNMLKTKITHKVIKEFFIDKMNWWDDAYDVPNEDRKLSTVHYYTSPCHRYILTYDCESNISDENGDGWNLHIDNSDLSSIGNVSVNYVEEVVQLIDIFKNY
jgi:hypothetical protein